MTVVRRAHYGRYAGLARLLPDRLYDIIRHRRITGHWPRLRNPQTINEKQLWLKQHYRDPLIRTCSDKAAVRAVVAERIGGLERFDPERMAGRVLGMGDVVSLVEDVRKAAAKWLDRKRAVTGFLLPKTEDAEAA
jgi:hypothetical protein